MGILSGLFAGGIKGLEDGTANIIGKFVEDPTKKAELAQQLAQLHSDEMTKMATLAEQQYEAQLKDNQSARDREVQIATSDKAPLINKIATPVIGGFVTLGFFGLLAYMLKYDVPAGNRDILNVMLGSLGTAWITIVSYYFGSSAGSKVKDNTISKLSS